MKLVELAEVIRSKNSGPYELTFDMIFKTEEIYNKVCAAKVITKESFAKVYKIDPAAVIDVVEFHPAKAIKVTIARPMCSGALAETDVYGAQQHTPLLGFEFEL